MSITPIFKRCAGLNTVLHPLRIPYNPEEGITALSAAVNVVVDDSGMITRREGYAEVDDQPWHSLFYDAGPCLGVRGTDLCLIDDDLNYTVLRSGMTSRVSYAQVNQDVYYTSQAGFGIVRNGLHVDWEMGPYVGPDTNRDFTGPFPADHIAFHNGRIWLARDGFLAFSEAYDWSRFDLHKGTIPLDSRVRMLKPLRTGMFVSTETTTYYLGGSAPDDYNLKKSADYPAIEGTVALRLLDAMELGFKEPGDGAVWASPFGVCFGTAFGFVVNLTRDSIKQPETAAFGAGMLDRYNYVYTTGV
jgi:hypothetical protein